MTPIQQLMLGTGSKNKVFLDDVFSTYLYTGDDSSYRNINNGIDLAGEGGMVWVRPRNNTIGINVFDTARGATKRLFAYADSAEGTDTSRLDQFNSNGFRVNGNYSTNGPSSYNYASWTFRKAKGFFTCLKFTGNNDGSNANRTISHELGSIPGCLIVKRTDAGNSNWHVYHRNNYTSTHSNPAGQWLQLDKSDSTVVSNNAWGGVKPTSTNFTIGWSLNVSGAEYIAYLFAGGESTAATARSVDFDGSDYLSIPDSADFDLGNGNFTAEMWVKSDVDVTSGNKGLLGQWASGNKSWAVSWSRANQGMDGWAFKYSTDGSNETGILGPKLDDDQWHHIAVVRDSTYIKLYTDGTLSATHTHSGATFYNSAATCRIANEGYTGVIFGGEISNVRLVKGTAVYTSSFRPPTEPLTNITNTKLLCCNNSSTTGSTVTPGTITAGGNPTASTDSPFDDPAGFVFGDAGESVIKCGSYVGSGSAPLEVNIGWEPSWLMIKATSRTGDWYIMDSMRGVVTSGNDEYVKANESDAEGSADVIEFTSTGFKVISTGTHWNNSAETYSFTAIRRSDGYVGKPAELGTAVFGLGTRSGSSSNALSNVNVFTDFSIIKRYNNGGEYWATNARFMGKYSLQTNSTDGQLTGALPTSGAIWDHMLGHLVAGSNGATNTGSDIIDYGWKRHAGLDVVAYVGNSTGDYSGMSQVIPHNLGKSPEMIWCKNRDASGSWGVYHKGLNGGTNPENYRLLLNDTHAESAASGSYTNWYWNNTAPTATHFSVGEVPNVNALNNQIIAMLFASVDGVSKVGSYTGTGSDLTITLGFQPRFVLIKDADNTASWFLFDTLRGIAAGTDKVLLLNDTDAQTNTEDRLDLTSDGMTLHPMGSTNENNVNFIYYCHA